MSALASAPEGLRELAEAVGLEPLKPLLLELDAELASFVTAPPVEPAALARQAHGLIGAAGGVGFMELAERCRALEHACKEGRDLEGPISGAQDDARAARSVIAALATA